MPVVVGAEVDRVLVDAIEQSARPRSCALGVAIGGRVIAVDIAENSPARRSADSARRNPARGAQRVVDRLVAVRMEN